MDIKKIYKPIYIWENKIQFWGKKNFRKKKKFFFEKKKKKKLAENFFVTSLIRTKTKIPARTEAEGKADITDHKIEASTEATIKIKDRTSSNIRIKIRFKTQTSTKTRIQSNSGPEQLPKSE